jgi:hypothetical protein
MQYRLLVALFLSLGALAGCDSGDDPTTGSDPPARTSDQVGGDTPGFLSACDPGQDQCGQGLTCFQFNTKGPLCTHACSGPADCEPPSPGCNNKGVCKAP